MLEFERRQLIVMGWKGVVYRALNRPVMRPFLTTGVSAIGTIKTRQRCRVSFDQGAWIREYAGGTLVEPSLDLKTLADIEHITYDYAMYQYVPAPGNIVLDIGAGTGWETLAFSKCVGVSGRVISIEAHPGTYRCLKEMCRRNGLENVTTLNCAATASEGDLHMTDNPLYVTNRIVADGGDIVVRGRTIASIVEEFELPRVDLLKMNIEGAERLAIEGLAGVIEKTRYVCICCHDFLAAQGASEEMRTKSTIVEFLRSKGFETFARELDSRPDVRDCVYGSNTALL